VRDKEKRIFAHPDKVHDIGHKGKYFEVPGIGLTEPSPQRTPVLFQAGSSDAGKTFSAKHAECKFISGPSSKIIKEYVSDTRQRTAKAGRDPKNILIFALATIIVDESDEKAQAKYEDYKKYISYDGTLALVSGWSGIDFGLSEATDTVEKAKKPESNAMLSLVERYTDGEEKDWSIKELVEWNGIGGGGPVFIGSPTTVADQLQEWGEETDVDGFNIAYAVSQEHIEDIVKYLVPELQKRGVYPTSYAEGTLRDKLFGHSKLPSDHPAARYRDIEKVKREEAKKI
jgi:FMN-dependent oxidoreductase (nitrilotriacetate monooxygenase family)